MPGVGGFEREPDRLEVAHLTDEDDVGVLAERAAQRRREGAGVRADFAMVDEAPLALVHELDRILDRDDVVLAVLVGVVDDGGERGRLARSRRPRDEHEALAEERGALEDRGQPELVRRDDLRRDLAEDGAAARALHEEVGAEAGHAGDLVAEVDVAGFLEHLDLLLGSDLVQHRPEVLVVERVVLHPLELAMHAEDRRLAGHDVQVGRPGVEHELEERVEPCHARSPRANGS